jgi:cytochrome c biogenesis protein CcmG/thiol:disulfide interchange protein DsbE
LFAALAVVFGIGLSLDPREVPSPLVGKPVPVF